MAVAIVTVAYRLPSVAMPVRTARSARHRLVFHLFVHSRDPATFSACEDLADSPNVRLYPYGFNRGLSRSWNEGILDAYEAGADVVIVCNDDLAFAPGDLDALADHALANRDRHIVVCAGWDHGAARRVDSLGYSCFALNPVALETIGCFDENFFPAYCEDQDYDWRARLAGLAVDSCRETSVRHWRDSTVSWNPELRRQGAVTFPLNTEYYARKWGGVPGDERFSRPFDDPRFGLRIAPEDRHAPYGPGYDRSDREAVVLR